MFFPRVEAAGWKKPDGGPGGGGGRCFLVVRWGWLVALCQPVQTSDSGQFLSRLRIWPLTRVACFVFPPKRQNNRTTDYQQDK